MANLPNPRREARAVDTLLRERAAAGELVLADMRRQGPRSWRGRLASDSFHPNDVGYADMATVFASALDGAGLPTDRPHRTPPPPTDVKESPIRARNAFL